MDRRGSNDFREMVGGMAERMLEEVEFDEAADWVRGVVPVILRRLEEREGECVSIDGVERVVDGQGHHRRVYDFLVRHLAGGGAGGGEVESRDREASIAERLWGLVVEGERDEGRVLAGLEEVMAVGSEGPLHGLEVNDADGLDAWTFDELAGLQALDHLAGLTDSSVLRGRVLSVAMFHLENTQPDNATNQPWGLAAFARSEETRSFAEQQLHDVMVHGAGGVLAGLLLADACLALRG